MNKTEQIDLLKNDLSKIAVESKALEDKMDSLKRGSTERKKLSDAWRNLGAKYENIISDIIELETPGIITKHRFPTY